MSAPQTYKNHRRFFPLHHYFVSPVLAINAFYQLWRFIETPSYGSAWTAVVAFALGGLVLSSRIMALTVQSRLIRLEERLRLSSLLPAEERPIVDKLGTRHLVGLRFASDEEAPELARRVARGELTTTDEIKRNIQEWRPDYLRA